MSVPEQWVSPSDIAAARQRLVDAMDGWRPPIAHSVAFVPAGEDLRAEHFVLVNTVEHLLPAAVMATVIGHRHGSRSYELTRSDLERAIALLEPAEACTAYEHPNLWRWRDDILPAWTAEPDARVIAAFVSEEPAADAASDLLRSAAADRTLTWRERLRALPTATPPIPGFAPDAAPDDPRLLFEAWLTDAIADGILLPHAATLSTAGPDGDVDARTLILKDLDDRGWWFATRTDGRKHRDLLANPRAALTFLWREHARQVRVRGTVTDAGRTAADADFLARPVHSRAAAIIGTQSAPLESREHYRAAFDAARLELEADPERTSAAWAAYVLRPLEIEFWTTTPDSGQIRLSYRRDDPDAPWRRGLLWP